MFLHLARFSQITLLIAFLQSANGALCPGNYSNNLIAGTGDAPETGL